LCFGCRQEEDEERGEEGCDRFWEEVGREERAGAGGGMRVEGGWVWGRGCLVARRPATSSNMAWTVLSPLRRATSSVSKEGGREGGRRGRGE